MLLTATSGFIQQNLVAVTRTSLLRYGAGIRSHAKLAVAPVSLPRDSVARETSDCPQNKPQDDGPVASRFYSARPRSLRSRLCQPSESHRDGCSSRVREPESSATLHCQSDAASPIARGQHPGVDNDEAPQSGRTPEVVACLSLPISAGTVVALTASGQPRVAHYLQLATSLSKARLTGLVVSSAVAGTMLAGSTSLASPVFLLHPVRSLVCLALGTALTSAAANTVNQIIEIPQDSQMTRTQNRPLVRGLTSPGHAGLFALGCFTTGMCILSLGTNSLVVGLALGNSLLYTTVYTPLKQVDQANTWIGALVGAVPPLMGWATATGELQSGALFLACLLYVWQFPHFMALSWNLRSQYSRAGHAMTCILEPGLCRRVALKYALASGLVCLAGAGCSAISLGPWAGCALGISCLPPNIGLVYYAWQFSRSSSTSSGPASGGGTDSSSLAARRLFRVTLLHLPVVMVVALIGTYYCALGPEFTV